MKARNPRYRWQHRADLVQRIALHWRAGLTRLYRDGGVESVLDHRFTHLQLHETLESICRRADQWSRKEPQSRVRDAEGLLETGTTGQFERLFEDVLKKC